jgi:hypothetical protein
MRRLRSSPSIFDRSAKARELSPLESVRSHQRIGCLPMFLPHRQAGQPVLRLTGLPAYEAKTPS